MSSKEFVSCFKLNGVPLLPPLLTEEERRECRLDQREAMLIEKELELKRKEEELEKLKEMYGSPPSKPPLPPEHNQWTLDILCFMVDSLCRDAHDLDEFKYLFDEFTKELKKELIKRGFSPFYSLPERASSRNCDSTYHDVESLTLNQNQDSVSTNTSIEEDSPCFDKESDKNSVILAKEVNYHSEISHVWLSPLANGESVAYKDISFNHLPQADLDISIDNRLYGSEYTASSPLEIPQSINHEENQLDDNGGMQTPPKLIRSNSYTLESPSPSVLAYLRNLSISNAIGSNSGGHTSSKGDSNTKSAARNLNNLWEYKDIEQNPFIPPSHSDNVVNVYNLEDETDNNKNLTVYEVERSESWQLRNESLENEHPVQNVSYNAEEQRKLKAAVTIQAAAKGFLVRRLMRTHKVETIKNTIKDAVLCAWELYKEHAVTPSDLQLHEMIIQQVTAACYELHSIFFKWSTAEKMALIKSDREKLKNPKPKFRSSRGNSESESSSSSRSTSRTRSSTSKIKSERGPKMLAKRPSSLPSVPRSSTPSFQPWS